MALFDGDIERGPPLTHLAQGLAARIYDGVVFQRMVGAGFRERNCSVDLGDQLSCHSLGFAQICGHRDLSPDRNGNGIIEAGEHIKECPCFDAIPWAASKGLPVADIRGNWGEVFSVPAANDAVTAKVMGPDARLVYLQKLLSLSGLQFGPIDGIVGDRTGAAIRLYQEWNGLTQSGLFDDATVKLLRSTFEKKAAA